MRVTKFLAAFALLLGVGRAQQEPGAPKPADPAVIGSAAKFDLGDAKKLKVLYAGRLDTPRANAYVEFLKANFAEVGTLAAEELSMATAAGWDVVVADGNRLYPMDPKKGIDLPKVTLGNEFTRPIVMVSALAGQMQHHTKIDWL